jgi:pyruvate dehydrogenase E1 component alpha subunit
LPNPLDFPLSRRYFFRVMRAADPDVKSSKNQIPRLPDLQPQEKIALFRKMLLIRRFEEKAKQAFTQAKIKGFCHLYNGQEAVAVGTISVLNDDDAVITAYRDHGHALTRGVDPNACMAELFGKITGCSRGKGGSMHFFDASVHNMGGHGIVGGHIPLGIGFAFTAKYKKTGGVAFIFFGDGAINQGTFNESLNLASLYKLPAIFIVENNGVAMGTQVARSSAEKDLAMRGSGFNMPHRNVDGNDIDTVIEEFTDAADRARAGEGPSYLVANTYRFRGHSMSDAMAYRTKEEMDRARLRDPISLFEARLREIGAVSEAQIDQMQQEVADEINAATEQADADPFPALEDRFNDALAEKYPLQK